MKFKAQRYGEFFQGRISTYTHKRPVFMDFRECIKKESQEWLVEFYPGNDLIPGMVLSIDHDEQNVLCEIVGRNAAGRYVRLLNPHIDLGELWEKSEPAMAEA